MDKVLFVLSLILIVAAIYWKESQSERIYLLTTPTNDKIYYDTNVEQKADDIEVWEIMDTSDSTDNQLKFYQQIKTLRKFSCSNHQYQVRWILSYAKSARQPQGSEDSKDVWHFIIPDSVEEKIFQQVCKS